MNFVPMVMLMTVGAAAYPGGDVVTFKYADVLVLDAADRPLFRSSRDYLLKMTDNPAGRVERYDPAGKRVLLSRAGPEYWVRCAELSPMSGSCPASPLKPSTRSIKIPRGGAPGESGLASRGLPACPGDPRCPKSD